MVKGVALTLGLNSIDPSHYEDYGNLRSCETDAKDMAQITRTQGFATKTLLTKDCTRANVIAEIKNASQTLSAGDIFMLTYSGHGSQIPDINNDENGKGHGQDETWCLYDAEIVDDELNNLYSKFSKGVRILIVSDSCYSAGVAFADIAPEKRTINDGGEYEIPYRKVKTLGYPSRDIAYHKNKAFYDDIQSNPELKGALKKVKASVLLLAASTELQESLDGDLNCPNSLFTEKLKAIWNSGAYQPKGRTKGYRAFVNEIKKQMPSYQTPCLVTKGKRNIEFKNQQPFTI